MKKMPNPCKSIVFVHMLIFNLAYDTVEGLHVLLEILPEQSETIYVIQFC